MTKHNCIFIHIPKAAGTSILSALDGSDRFVQRDHCTALDFIKADKKTFEASYKFCFVREPVDRIQSVYRYLSSGGNKTTNIELSSIINNEYSNFDEFVDGFISYDNIFCNKLLFPQYHFVCNIEGKLLVQNIFRYENIKAGFLEVCNELGIDKDLPLINPSIKEKSSIEIDTKNKIKEIYSRDYDYFYPELR
ncbi:sulfotransferase family 2 domain-containing protein [Alteromonas sp. H39]|uniref:sulfotransferase family 2 domain-containing protein n=1 Tax=Alteromonas sp. H39 TaxID=3389876 RepID=UPI0039E1CEDC